MTDYSYLINKPPVSEIINLDLVNKPSLDELAHHGILGMHWGVRRYQDKNGNLTELGRRHLARLQAENPKKAKKFVKKVLRSQEKIAAENDKQRKKNLKKAQKAKKIKAQEVQKAAQEALKNMPKEIDDKTRKHLDYLAKNPAKFAKTINKYNPQEVDYVLNKARLNNTINELRNNKLTEVKQTMDTLLTYGKTFNDALTFINSPVGRGIRQWAGLPSDKIFDFDTKPEDVELNRAKRNADLAKAQADIAKARADVAKSNSDIKNYMKPVDDVLNSIQRQETLSRARANTVQNNLNAAKNQETLNMLNWQWNNTPETVRWAANQSSQQQFMSALAGSSDWDRLKQLGVI